MRIVRWLRREEPVPNWVYWLLLLNAFLGLFIRIAEIAA